MTTGAVLCDALDGRPGGGKKWGNTKDHNHNGGKKKKGGQNLGKVTGFIIRITKSCGQWSP